jgi:ATP phosphoribosyltransferase regulatory subunit
MENKLHTPEGVRDIYNVECKKKLALQENLLNNLYLFGYQDIQTPTFEYLDVFRKEIGGDPVKDLYKFFDNEGNILAMRPDITPSIARAVATLFEDEDMPARLCYVGNTFINHSSYQGRLKESTQLGAELIGDDSVEADAEMIAMMVIGLKKTGLTQFQVNVGHVDFIKSLLAGTKLEEEVIDEIRNLLSNRNYFAIEDILVGNQVKEEIVTVFKALPELNGNRDMLTRAAEIAPTKKSKRAIVRLLKLYTILTNYGVEEYINFDLSISGKYGYYSGVVFRAYTPQTGEAIVRGGRYDQMLSIFGQKRPSVGFAIIVDYLLNALLRQNIDVRTRETNIVVYTEATAKKALAMAMNLRSKGKFIELIRHDSRSMEELVEYGIRKDASTLFLYLEPEIAKMMNLITGEQKDINYKTEK